MEYSNFLWIRKEGFHRGDAEVMSSSVFSSLNGCIGLDDERYCGIGKSSTSRQKAMGKMQ